MIEGHVALVGAGPGDAALITVKGLRHLQAADVVIYDALVNDELLLECRPGTLLIDVGKRCGQPAPTQEAINALLVTHAGAGRHVVRLKGGDPFVFGRGGEEALALAAAGVSWEVVPGISSSVGVPAYAGIPVTHRGIASSFAVVTGHERSGGIANIDWKALATGVDTLVVLMGVGRLASIAEQLITHGRLGSTPTAVIRWGTIGVQETVVATLATIAAEVVRAGVGSPATLVVGEVVALREQLNWFELQQLDATTI